GSYQPDYMTNASADDNRNIFITKLQPVPLDLNDLAIPQVSAYPNPNKGNFTIATSQNTIQAVSIHNVLGQRIQEILPNANTTEINIGNVPPGIYFVAVTLENSDKETLKVVVE
ncbi:MAG TPA: T9SS type A sorting domain-containing protein, partial [Aequorivita sp.]|nr:T9SS type A sorting domain-containing protein [Aequorivita sp.]